MVPTREAATSSANPLAIGAKSIRILTVKVDMLAVAILGGGRMAWFSKQERRSAPFIPLTTVRDGAESPAGGSVASLTTMALSTPSSA